MRSLIILAVSTAVLLTGCSAAPTTGPANGPPAAAQIVVAAGASLADALTLAQTEFTSAHPEVQIRFSFASSGTLQQQIEQGAPVDLFIAAAQGPIDALARKGLLDPAGVKTLATNQVVLIRSKLGPETVRDWADLKNDGVRKIAIGNPAHTPVGQYTQQVLERLSLWNDLQSRLVMGEDVHQVLRYVETGEMEAGVLYSTDAALSEKVVVIAKAPAGSHTPVTYPMAVLKDAKSPAAARAFADYLLSPAGRRALLRYGFEVGS